MGGVHHQFKTVCKRMQNTAGKKAQMRTVRVVHHAVQTACAQKSGQRLILRHTAEIVTTGKDDQVSLGGIRKRRFPRLRNEDGVNIQ